MAQPPHRLPTPTGVDVQRQSIANRGETASKIMREPAVLIL
ncbi:hypothetical protein TOK_0273 [Pseudonocardia sp. N23]|nr:hypothetical protein TOK_0273 [Pseudonocardia sp. N23]